MTRRARALTLTLTLVLLAAGFAGCIDAEDLRTSQATPETPLDDTTDFSDTAVYEGDYATYKDLDFSHVLEDGPLDFLPQELVELESTVDGAEVQIGIVRPDVPEGEKVPVVVHASPYFNDLSIIDYRERTGRLTENLVPHGYAVALVAVRGTADSGGCSDLMGPKERADLDQAITHLGEAEWSNGNVGMIGVSYDGSTPWEVAAEGNPHLKTIVPISGVNDIYHLMFKNGTTESRGPLILNALYYAYGFVFNQPLDGRSVPHTAEGIMCPEAYEGFTASMYSAYHGERDPTGFWEERNSRPGVEANYEGSIFHIQGLQDWNVDPGHQYPWVNELEDQGITVKHLLGQWYHAWPDGWYLGDEMRRYDFMEQIKRWFDHELKENASVDVGAKVQVQDSQMRWRTADAWPPEGEQVTLHPTTDLTLDEDPDDNTAQWMVSADVQRTNGLFTPSVAGDAPCGGCVTFSTDTVSEELRFAGLPTFHATVTPTAPGGSIAAFLYAEDGDGERTRLGWGQIDLRFRGGGEQAQEVVPGETYVAKLQFEPLDAVVPADSKLVLVVSQGSYGDHDAEPLGPMWLHVGDGQSPLTLNVVDPSPEQFFVPPGQQLPSS